MDWVYIIINIQTLWTNLIVTYFTNINNNYNQQILNDVIRILYRHIY